MQQTHIQRRTGLVLTTLTTLVFLAAPLSANTAFEDYPAWESSEQGRHASGIALADINNDGFLDVIVANGSDTRKQHLCVYYNDGAGMPQTTAGWQSADSAYHGNLAVGDVNGDGLPDVAVSVLFNNEPYADSGYVKLYINRGGELEANPSWRSADMFNSYSCAFGDPDGDGDLDLTAMAGEVITERRDRSRIYYNDEGELNTSPGWQHELLYLGGDAVWADFDRDGRLAPAMTYQFEPNRIFPNAGHEIGPRDKWFSQDRAFYGRDLTTADADGDGWIDLFVANGGYSGGVGYLKLYRNERNAGMGRTPVWQSDYLGVNTGVRCMDLYKDGNIDIVATAWNRGLMIWRRSEEGFSAHPSWESRAPAISEGLALGDLDNSALVTEEFTFEFNQGRNVFTLDGPFRRVVSMYYLDLVFGPHDYCFQGDQGWVSVSNEYKSGELNVTIERSSEPDVAVANWDADRGNYIYFFDAARVDVPEKNSTKPALDIFPQPAADRLYLADARYGSQGLSMVVDGIEVLDALGRKFFSVEYPHGTTIESVGELDVSAWPVGVYYLQLRSGESVEQRAVVIAR